MLFTHADWLVQSIQRKFKSVHLLQPMRQKYLLRVSFLTIFWCIERNKLIFLVSVWYYTKPITCLSVVNSGG